MTNIKFIWTGKLKTPHWREAADHYLKAVKRHWTYEQVVVKDAPGSLPMEERLRVEGGRIMDKLSPGDLPVCLDERGKFVTSPGLAKLMRGWLEDPGVRPCFIVGGAWGLWDEVKAMPGRRSQLLSLGPMTLPHELARVVLLEQIYRAASILKNLPYHHA